MFAHYLTFSWVMSLNCVFWSVPLLFTHKGGKLLSLRKKVSKVPLHSVPFRSVPFRPGVNGAASQRKCVKRESKTYSKSTETERFY